MKKYMPDLWNLPYSSVTQQPLKGKGAQRLGEMEVCACKLWLSLLLK